MKQPVAPSRRGLRSGASSHRQASHGEVLPQYNDTHKKDPSRRTPKSLLSQAHPDRRTHPATTESGCIRYSGLDGKQLSSHAGIDRIRRAADNRVGEGNALSTNRSGNCPGARLGGRRSKEASSLPLRRRATPRDQLTSVPVAEPSPYSANPSRNPPSAGPPDGSRRFSRRPGVG